MPDVNFHQFPPKGSLKSRIVPSAGWEQRCPCGSGRMMKNCCAASWQKGDNHGKRNAPCPCGSGKKYKRCCGKGGHK